ncbi:NACHT, LRR and PYD domains-containing protein 1b allele 2-like [Garra rufa]|uniref:NACHT, LRR and PYD domains-containing protein 1b allele 2-like n=1 Tax=Garra rufa TaxID=137080 RepID=UPI003CCEB11A
MTQNNDVQNKTCGSSNSLTCSRSAFHTVLCSMTRSAELPQRVSHDGITLLTEAQTNCGKIHNEYQDIYQQNREASRMRCEEVLRDVFDKMEKSISDGSYLKKRGGYQKYRDTLAQLTSDYRSEDVLSKYLRAKEEIGNIILQADQYLNAAEREKEDQGSDSVSYLSLKAQSSARPSTEDTKVFTPELVHRGDEDKHNNTYRFVCPHAGQFQCSLTSLVFVMEGKGEVLYRVVSWDPCLLDLLGQMKPAGPLYNIDCSAKSVSRLLFPHCVIYSEEKKDSLAVAHFTGGNVEIMPPLKVTETHVMVDIRDLSSFVLVWIRNTFSSQIDGQVLLFLRTITHEHKEKILNVHLLPGNVPVSEVQLKHHNKTYIETTSQCYLFPDREYSLHCQQEKCVVQPKSQLFKLNFGPNYHPTFEVFLDVSVEEVGLSILDKPKKGNEVWHRQRILLTAPSKGVEPSAQTRIPETEFVNTHGDKLIKRALSGMAIADSLKSKNMITREMWNKIHAAETPQEKMRHLLDTLESGGDNAKVEFCKVLKENEPYLVNELGPHL